MTDGATCPFCGDVLEDVTCGRRVECFDQALEQGLIVERDMTPEEIAELDASTAEAIRDGEAHFEAFEAKMKENTND